MKNIILSISGGGAGGEASSYGLSLTSDILPELEDSVCAYAGTSVGSIEAAFLAKGGLPHQLHDVLKKNNSKVFTKNSWISRYFKKAPRYNSKYLRDILLSVFGDMTMDQLKTECYIVAYQDTDKKCDSRHRRIDVFSRKDNDIAVVDAILASTAAPLYFSPHKIKDVVYGDGGLVDNLPSDIALSTHKKLTGYDTTFFKVVSVITGGAQKGRRKGFKFGSFFSLAKNLPGSIIPADIDGEIYKVDNYVGESRHLVLRPPLTEFDLDDVKIQKKLKSEWMNYLSDDDVQLKMRKWYCS